MVDPEAFQTLVRAAVEVNRLAKESVDKVRQPERRAVSRAEIHPSSPSLTDESSSAEKTRPKLLSGGNPQIAKADGDAPVQAYIAAMPDWKRDIGRRLDSLITLTVPNVRKAVKWNSPFYGIEGQGWFVSFHVFTRYVKVNFFQGASLHPVPPGGTGKNARWIDIHEDDLDETQLVEWIRQAAELSGWMP